MFPDDVYRKELATVIATLSGWAKRQEGTAAIDVREGPGFWRIASRPLTRGACPFTLVLRADQKFDLGLASEAFEDRPVDDFELFEAIAEAVADGGVEIQNTSCALTGAPRARTTRVIFSDRSVWSHTHRAGSGTLVQHADREITQTQRFLPYRR